MGTSHSLLHRFWIPLSIPFRSLHALLVERFIVVKHMSPTHCWSWHGSAQTNGGVAANSNFTNLINVGRMCVRQINKHVQNVAPFIIALSLRWYPTRLFHICDRDKDNRNEVILIRLYKVQQSYPPQNKKWKEKKRKTCRILCGSINQYKYSLASGWSFCILLWSCK